MKHTSYTAALLALALAACQQPSDDNIAIDDVNNLATAGNIENLPPSEEGGAPVDLGSGSNAANMANQADGDTATPPVTTTIPAAFRGRWGMVAADCTSTRGDAKGLILVDSGSIKFYESRAVLNKVTLNAPENFTGDFTFTGEGQTWKKPQNLKLTGSSNTLTRADDEGSYNYTRCRA